MSIIICAHKQLQKNWKNQESNLYGFIFQTIFLSKTMIDTYKKNFLLDIITLFSCHNRTLHRLFLDEMSVKERSVQLRVIIEKKKYLLPLLLFFYTSNINISFPFRDLRADRCNSIYLSSDCRLLVFNHVARAFLMTYSVVFLRFT